LIDANYLFFSSVILRRVYISQVCREKKKRRRDDCHGQPAETMRHHYIPEPNNAKPEDAHHVRLRPPWCFTCSAAQTFEASFPTFFWVLPSFLVGGGKGDRLFEKTKWQISPVHPPV